EEPASNGRIEIDPVSGDRCTARVALDGIAVRANAHRMGRWAYQEPGYRHDADHEAGSEPGRWALQAETVDEVGGAGRQQYPAERKAGRRNGERDGAAPCKPSGNQRRSGNKRGPRVT